jgi:hypothetical protein
MVSLAILKVIKEVLILKLKAYCFVCFQLFIIIGCQSNIIRIFCIAKQIFGFVFKYFFGHNYRFFIIVSCDKWVKQNRIAHGEFKKIKITTTPSVGLNSGGKKTRIQEKKNT